MAYEADSRSDQVDLFACSLDDPAFVAPEFHVFAEEQLPWLEVLDSLPRYAGSSTGAAPIRNGPRPR